MRRGLFFLLTPLACVTTHASSFSAAPTPDTAVLYGRVVIREAPIDQLTLVQEADPMAPAVNALVDADGNFAFVLEPGAYLLYSFHPQNRAKRVFNIDDPNSPDRIRFEVGAHELVFAGAFEGVATGVMTTKGNEWLVRDDTKREADVLPAIIALAQGTPWEPRLKASLGAVMPAAPATP
jgi:hypothetical protein